MRLKFLFLFLITIFIFCACAKNPIESSNNTNGKNSNSANDIIKLESIDSIKKNLNQQVEYIKNAKYQNISFDSDLNVAFPDINELRVLKIKENESASIDNQVNLVKKAIKKWYPEGANDEFLKANLRIDGDRGQKLGDSSLPVPYNYAKFYDFSNEKNINGLFLDSKDFYIMTDGIGIIQMSKGKEMHIIRGENDFASNYINLDIIEKISSFGNSEKSFQLLKGQMTYKQAQDYVVNFFNNELLNERDSMLSTNVPEIITFKLKDNTYGLNIIARRTFNNIPFDYVISGSISSAMSDGKEYKRDMMFINIIEANDFDWICSNSASESIIPDGKASNSMISLKKIIDIVSEKFSGEINLKISNIDLIYTQLVENENTFIARPTWKVRGINSINNKTVDVYVDALNGECRYMTYQ